MTDLSGGRRIWLGGVLLSSGWSWSDGTPWDYQNWEPGQPSGNGEECLSMEQTEKWNDRSCDNIAHDIGYVYKIIQKPGRVNPGSVTGNGRENTRKKR